MRVMGDWEFLCPQKKSATYTLHMWSLDGLQENVCSDGEGFLQSSLHSAMGCTKIIVISAALWSILMELHEGNSIMGYSR